MKKKVPRAELLLEIEDLKTKLAKAENKIYDLSHQFLVELYANKHLREELFKLKPMYEGGAGGPCVDLGYPPTKKNHPQIGRESKEKR